MKLIKNVISIVLASLILIFTSVQSSAFAKTLDGNMFLQNITHEGVNNTKGLEKMNNVKWKFKTSGKVYASPIVLNGIAYIGSEDNNFYAIDIATGNEKWHYKTGGAVNSTCAISNGIAYFASKDGYFYALDIADGGLKWKFKTKGEKMKDIWDYYLSSPVVYNGVVYFGSGDTNLYALNCKTGKKMWSYKTNDIVHSSPAIAYDNVYFGSFDGALYAVSTKTGKLSWKFQTVGYALIPGGVQSSPLITKDGLVYFGSRDFNIYALDAKTGKGYWNIKTPSWVISTPVFKDDTLFYGNSDDPHFYSYNMNNININWATPVSLNIFGSSTVVGDTGYFGSFNGKLYAIDLKTGEFRWTFQTDASKQNYSTVVNEKDQFRSELWDTYSAEQIYDMIQSLGSILSTPAVEDGVVYFGSTDGYVYALE